jgi:hypothetical protein
MNFLQRRAFNDTILPTVRNCKARESSQGGHRYNSRSSITSFNFSLLEASHLSMRLM